MSRPARLLLPFLICFTARAAEVSAPSLPAALPPAPALAAAAAREKLPLEGIAALTSTEAKSANATLSTADRVVLLVSSTDGKLTRQWLAELRGDALTASEAKAPAPAAKIIHTSTGRSFTFASRLAALNVRLFGPAVPNAAAATAPAQAKTARLLVNIDFLRAGFARNASLALRLHENKVSLPYHLSASPFAAERIANDAKLAQAAGLQLEDERAIAATGPALTEFLNLIGDTPVLKDILMQVMEMPSPMGWLRGGQTGFFFDPPKMERLEGAVWQLPGKTVYRAPFRYFLKGKPAIIGSFYFVEPAPPLLACAGILGITAEAPSRPEKKVELRVLAAERK